MSLYESAVPTFNLFWILRTLPIGISSLMFARDVPQTPLGTVASWQVSAQAMPLWIMGLVVLGWIGGGLYFRGVARACRQQSDPASPHVAWAVGQSVLLSLLWLALAVALALPTFVVVSLLLQVNTTVAQVAILAVSFFSMWLIVPLFFWPHGVFLRRQNVLLSMLSSLRMTRFTLPTSSFFVLSAFLLGVGLNLIWGAAPSDSWMTLVGILGHGFITTALLAASFIYYRDMSAWLDTALERLRAKGAVPKQI
jgi:hypothetical protein